jgi:hypothetical protein
MTNKITTLFVSFCSCSFTEIFFEQLSLKAYTIECSEYFHGTVISALNYKRTSTKATYQKEAL